MVNILQHYAKYLQFITFFYLISVKVLHFLLLCQILLTFFISYAFFNFILYYLLLKIQVLPNLNLYIFILLLNYSIQILFIFCLNYINNLDLLFFHSLSIYFNITFLFHLSSILIIPHHLNLLVNYLSHHSLFMNFNCNYFSIIILIQFHYECLYYYFNIFSCCQSIFSLPVYKNFNLKKYNYFFYLFFDQARFHNHINYRLSSLVIFLNNQLLINLNLSSLLVDMKKH